MNTGEYIPYRLDKRQQTTSVSNLIQTDQLRRNPRRKYPEDFQALTTIKLLSFEQDDRRQPKIADDRRIRTAARVVWSR